MLFFNNTIKHNFKQLLDNANFIYQEASSCLTPVADVYWHYYYTTQMHYNLTLLITNKDLQYSLNALSLYIDQLTKIEQNLNIEYSKNTKYLIKFQPELEKFNNWSKELNSMIETWIKNIRQIPNYKDFSELPFIIKNLNVLNKKLKYFKCDEKIITQ